MQELASRCKEIMKAQMIEIPLTFLKQSKPSKTSRSSKSISKATSSNTKQGKLQFMRDINDEVQLMMDAAEDNEIF